MELSPAVIYEWSEKATVVVILAVAVIGFYRKWWVPGWVVAEKDRYIEKLEAKDAKWQEILTRIVDLPSRRP